MPMRRNRHHRTLSMQALQHTAPDMHLVVLVRSHGRCWYCAQELTLTTIDHQQPVCQGGQAVLDNVVASCPPCNAAKGGNSLATYRALCGGELFWGERASRKGS